MRLRSVLATAIAFALQAPIASAAPQPEGLVTLANASDEAAHGLRAFAARAGEPLVAVFVEVDGAPAFAAKAWRGDAAGTPAGALAHHASVRAEQDALIARLAAEGLELLPRSKTVEVAPGRTQRIDYRFSYLANGFVAYMPASRVPALRGAEGVRSVSRIAPTRLFLDHSANYMLGSQPAVADRRLAVYGASEELGPASGASNAPALVPTDGHEGHGILLGVIDSGMDFEHPMLGGSGVGTPQPQRPPLTTSSANGKVVYWNNLGGATTLDDHGHGTHVSSTAGGYLVDGTTASVTPTGSVPFGPTPGGVALHGVAPQVRLMGWPVCAATGNCAGDVELAIEDAVSPVVLVGTGDGGAIPTAVAKPVADVINMSLGGGNDPAAPSSRVANTAVLASGAVVVAAAGNDGPVDASVGAPCVGTLVLCVASVLDPGSTAGSDMLSAGETAADGCADSDSCAITAPAAETGSASEANLAAAGERSGIKTFVMAGGGDLPGGSVSAHYVFVDRDEASVPAQVAGRIAVLEGGTGSFAQIVNPVAALAPAAILLITDTASATAVAVLNDVPTFTVAVADGAYLKQQLHADARTPVHGAVSQRPLRVRAAIAPEAFTGAVSDFSSRGPNAAPNGLYRTIKPDLAALGQGVLAATTPTGNVDAGIGMANASGYTTANGTSMASPHVAGAAALVRQRVRALGHDSVDANAPDHAERRFHASTLVRALLVNTATDLRTGLGGDDPDAPNPPYTIHDVGAGLVDVDAALRAHAVMTAPTVLFEAAPDEFTVPAGGSLPLPLDEDGNLLVPLPSASFGSVRAIGATRPVAVEREVTIADIDGQGGGSWQLSLVDDVLSTHPDIKVVFYDASGVDAISEVVVPANGSASFRVRLGIDGDGSLAEGALVSFYLHATHAGSGQRLRMPFLAHLVRYETPALQLPGALVIDDAGPANSDGCAVDLDNAFAASWSHASGEGLDPQGWRLQRGTFEVALFEDDASEPLVAGANSLWSGSPQWTAGSNPDTGSTAYFIPNAAEQAEALTLIEGLPLPGGGAGATLEVQTRIDTEAGFDFASIRASGDGGAFATLGRFSGISSGTLNFDLSAYAGSDLLLQFLMESDLAVPAPGWWVDHVRVTSNDFGVLSEHGAAVRSVPQSVNAPGTWRFRVAGLYPVDDTEVVGPYTASACVCVPTSAFGAGAPVDRVFASGFEAGESPAVSCD